MALRVLTPSTPARWRTNTRRARRHHCPAVRVPQSQVRCRAGLVGLARLRLRCRAGLVGLARLRLLRRRGLDQSARSGLPRRLRAAGLPCGLQQGVPTFRGAPCCPRSRCPRSRDPRVSRPARGQIPPIAAAERRAQPSRRPATTAVVLPQSFYSGSTPAVPRAAAAVPSIPTKSAQRLQS
jgi:hypothetical protein